MVRSFLRDAISRLYPDTNFDILTPPNPEMGDYSVNLAFMLAKKEGKNPGDVGKDLALKLSQNEELSRYFKKIELAGAGFVNLYLSDDFLRSNLIEILEKKEEFGSGADKNFKINLEFVSANPTGPLTVANIRAASFGDTLASVLRKAGYGVAKEYYINDAGNQVRLLGESIARRYLRIKGKTIDFPENLYQGEYVVDIAREIDEKNIVDSTENFDDLVKACRDYGVKKLLASAKNSLNALGIEFDVWFSEATLHQGGEVGGALKILEKGKHIYDKDGARWLRMSDKGEEDAVLVKSDGLASYLMGDIAYTRNKFIRGFNKAINIWGADHHGDAPRLKAGVRALGYEKERLEILLHQLVFIKSGGEKQKMSKRKGEFVLLDDLLSEVNKDAIRFFFLMKDLNTHMEFDVDLAKEQSKKNPVYYIQYAYARLNSIFEKLKVESRKLKVEEEALELLREPEELFLMRKMAKWPELIGEVAGDYQIHRLAQYSYELASRFHNFYEKHKVVQDDKKIEKARLLLCAGVALILESALGLMGLSAPKKMIGSEKGSA